jgi:uncharacterized protein
MVIGTRRRGAAAAVVGAALAWGVSTAPGASASTAAPRSQGTNGVAGLPLCAPSAAALSYSDSLDKLVYDGVELGGLSSLAYDARSGSWASAVDNHAADPARIWFFRNLADPAVTRDPLVLKRPDGTPYDGTDSDNEGLAVLPDGDFLVSSETEPSIRIYGRDGVQKAELPVPARFAVTGTTPDGQATGNTTLEGLTVTPDGREIVAAMEGALSGDVSPAGDADAHRFLVYRQDAKGVWQLAEQIEYRTDTGMRVPEVVAYTDDALVVEEASFTATEGNAVNLYAVTGLSRAKDVSAVADLSAAPASDAVPKTLVADLVDCPTLGATAKQTQANPLLDNFEGMAVTGRALGLTWISLISDDNFNPAQSTRVLNLVARLP